MKDVLTNAISEFPKEKTKAFCAVLQQLRTLGGEQIRNVAVCCALLAVMFVTNVILLLSACKTCIFMSVDSSEFFINASFFELQYV